MAKKKGSFQAPAAASGGGGLPDPRLVGVGAAVALALAVAYYGLIHEVAILPIGNGPADDLIRLGQRSPHVTLNVYPTEFPGIGRGLAAARSFKEGDVVMEIPFLDDAMISKENLPRTMAMHSGKKGLLEPGHQGAKQMLVLAVMLERQKFKETPWVPFFDSLPRKILNLAVMGDVHRRALNSTDLAAKFEQYDEIYNATRVFVKAAKALFTIPPSDQEIAWACAAVESRAHMHANGEERILWPYLVLTNHHHDIEKTLQYASIPETKKKPAVTQLLARSDIRQGEQVFLHYGGHSNTRLLVQYGFSIPDNPILDPMPIRMVTTAGADLFKFGGECRELATNAQEYLKRQRDQPATIPELFVNCWRISKFDDWDGVERARTAGMFASPGSEEHFTASPALPTDWLERDAAVFEDIRKACTLERDGYTMDGGVALAELGALTDALSQNLHSALQAEIGFWDQCRTEMARRAQRTRDHLATVLR